MIFIIFLLPLKMVFFFEMVILVVFKWLKIAKVRPFLHQKGSFVSSNLPPTRMSASHINGCNGNSLLFLLTDCPCCYCLYSVGKIFFCAYLNISNFASDISDVVNSVQFALILYLDITLFFQICLILNIHETVLTNL